MSDTKKPSNVVGLDRKPIDPKALDKVKPNDELIELLSNALQMAKSGALQEAVIVGYFADGYSSYDLAVDEESYGLEFFGAIYDSALYYRDVCSSTIIYEEE